MYLPIPSLNYKYEIDERGKVRNAETKKNLKPVPRKNRKVKTVRVMFEGHRKECSVQQLLWEVHGKMPKLKRRRQIAVTVCNADFRYFFSSLNQAAIFLSSKVHYTKEWINWHFAKRIKEIFGWKIYYHEAEKRKIRSVDVILETRRICRGKKNDLARIK